MANSEFQIIAKYFTSAKINHPGHVILGVGDDAAILAVPVGKNLFVSTDTLVADVHFSSDTPVKAIAHKALAVNISDLAAMGVKPSWFTLALTMPTADAAWLKEFSQALFKTANHNNIDLVGGDTTRGPLSLTITIAGYGEHTRAMQRKQAKVGDLVYVTGELGSASLALQYKDFNQDKLLYPNPNVNFAHAISTYVKCAIDISDGLCADLGHIAEASRVGIVVDAANLPYSQQARARFEGSELLKHALYGGDDYELCFTVAPEYNAKLLQAAKAFNVRITEIGSITANKGLAISQNGQTSVLLPKGWDHFKL